MSERILTAQHQPTSFDWSPDHIVANDPIWRRIFRFITPWWLICALPLLIIPVGEARADTISDVAYLTTLDQFRVHYSSEDAAIALGHSVCDGLHAGILPRRIALLVADGGGYSMDDAGTIVGAYCDTFMPTSATPASTVGGAMGGALR